MAIPRLLVPLLLVLRMMDVPCWGSDLALLLCHVGLIWVTLAAVLVRSNVGLCYGIEFTLYRVGLVCRSNYATDPHHSHYVAAWVIT